MISWSSAVLQAASKSSWVEPSIRLRIRIPLLLAPSLLIAGDMRGRIGWGKIACAGDGYCNLIKFILSKDVFDIVPVLFNGGGSFVVLSIFWCWVLIFVLIFVSFYCLLWNYFPTLLSRRWDFKLCWFV